MKKYLERPNLTKSKLLQYIFITLKKFWKNFRTFTDHVFENFQKICQRLLRQIGLLFQKH